MTGHFLRGRAGKAASLLRGGGLFCVGARNGSVTSQNITKKGFGEDAKPLDFIGAPDWIRTSGLLLRRQKVKKIYLIKIIG